MQNQEQIDTQGVDFATLAAIGETLHAGGSDELRPRASLQAAPGGGGVGGILTGILSNPTLLQAILSFFGGLFKKAPKPTPAPPAVEPAPAPPAPEPSTPQPSVPSAQRKVASLRAKWYFFEALLTKGTATKFGKRVIVGKGEYDAILAGDSPLGLGYRLHIDITPYDQFGKPFLTGDPDNDRCLLIDPALGPVEANNRVRHNIFVDGVLYGPQGDTVPGTPWDGQDLAGLTSEYDGYAMTPVLTLAEDLPLSVERKITYRPDFENPDGTIVTGPTLPVLRFKPWAVPDAQ